MPCLSLNQVSLTLAGPKLFNQVNLQIDLGERLGLLGRNGAGKSTLLKILEGTLAPDEGEVVRDAALRIASVPQEVPEDLTGRVGDYLRHACGVRTSDRGWEIETRIEQSAADLALDLESDLASLSAGSKRRVLLASALVRDPDLLILDEPTNHLDLETIAHLEEALGRRRGALVFVTHDRAFLRSLATRILDLDRGTLRSYPADYDTYLTRREEELRVEADQAALFDRKLAQEEAWLRRGIKARRTRNEGRVRALEALRVERRARREDGGRVRATLQDADRSGRMVLRARDLGFEYPKSPIVDGLDFTLMRGDRVGILGPNGCGKTTLLSLLLGELEPRRGSVTPGTKLEIARGEQLHDSLDASKTVRENIGEGREMIDVGGSERHVVGYLQDFLFTPEQIQGPVTRLSGGERNRLQLARVLSRPCNLLVLDEPTNDLDLETLEHLEELLLDYAGTLLLVSHDRAFLDNVVTSTLAYEGPGLWREYVGGYEDWVRQRPVREVAPRRGSAPSGKRAVAQPAGSAARRLGYQERRELNDLPGRIERLEAERHARFELMSSPEFYSRPGDQIATARRELEILEREIHDAYTRWTDLDARNQERTGPVG